LLGWLDLSTEPTVVVAKDVDLESLSLRDAPTFVRGDANDDGTLDISDALSLLIYLFQEREAAIPCLDAADADDSGELDLTDAVRILRYLFTGGQGPPPPGAIDAGTDPTADGLDCVRAAP
ncbi:MAG TPA: hypothetical protein VK116_07600, partial [Planctomycetota bacterium]|nr:hypothetical protein [Planctomycetota bacterium]